MVASMISRQFNGDRRQHNGLAVSLQFRHRRGSILDGFRKFFQSHAPWPHALSFYITLSPVASIGI